MKSEDIVKEMKKTLLKYQAGYLSQPEARQELAILLGIRKAYETLVLEERLERIEQVLEDRRAYGN